MGLEGDFGEVRMGRELTAAYNATSRYDVFGQVGYGASRRGLTLRWVRCATTNATR